MWKSMWDSEGEPQKCYTRSEVRQMAEHIDKQAPTILTRSSTSNFISNDLLDFNLKRTATNPIVAQDDPLCSAASKVSPTPVEKLAVGPDAWQKLDGFQLSHNIVTELRGIPRKLDNPVNKMKRPKRIKYAVLFELARKCLGPRNRVGKAR